MRASFAFAEASSYSVSEMNDMSPARLKSFGDVFAAWPGGRNGLAADVGVSTEKARKWDERDFIPCEYWHDIIVLAGKKSLPQITSDALALLASKRRK